MNRYEPSHPRFLFGIIALALTVLTFAASVVVPTHRWPLGPADMTLAQRTLRATPIAISPAHVEVIGIREAKLAVSPGETAAKPKPGG